jgi:hypothetical protein
VVIEQPFKWSITTSIQIYDFIENKTQLRVNKFIKENSVVKKCVKNLEVIKFVTQFHIQPRFYIGFDSSASPALLSPVSDIGAHFSILSKYLWTTSAVFS